MFFFHLCPLTLCRSIPHRPLQVSKVLKYPTHVGPPARTCGAHLLRRAMNFFKSLTGQAGFEAKPAESKAENAHPYSWLGIWRYSINLMSLSRLWMCLAQC